MQTRILQMRKTAVSDHSITPTGLADDLLDTCLHQTTTLPRQTRPGHGIAQRY
ncbi:MAG: hypothetical protein KME20_22865 [Kaiparowitsia implicata GSE-PSE-MK54-09C]|nr:hypothetical protein [Kaiparowitsia implicata GSE-PSE-MK54-09C]